MLQYLEDVLNLIYPRTCLLCGNLLPKTQHHLCFICISNLPQTGFHYLNENPVQKLFRGRIDFQFASAWLNFESGNSVQAIMHELKYKNNPGIGEFMGVLMARSIMKGEKFKNADAIIPLPLHPKKEKKRGYNQSAQIGLGLSKVFNIPLMEKAVLRKTNTKSQTKRKRYDRWLNVDSAFFAKSEMLQNVKHVILVDDVVTTGASLESCGREIMKTGNTEVSVLCLARTM